MCLVGVLWRFEADEAIVAIGRRSQFVGTLRRHEGWAVDEYAASVVFSELVGNVATHSPGPIEITLECDNRLFQREFARVDLPHDGFETFELIFELRGLEALDRSPLGPRSHRAQVLFDDRVAAGETLFPELLMEPDGGDVA